jgi:hypothetical protein
MIAPQATEFWQKLVSILISTSRLAEPSTESASIGKQSEKYCDHRPGDYNSCVRLEASLTDIFKKAMDLRLRLEKSGLRYLFDFAQMHDAFDSSWMRLESERVEVPEGSRIALCLFPAIHSYGKVEQHDQHGVREKVLMSKAIVLILP